MPLSILHNKKEIFDFLSKNRELQVYSIGDLDDFFWPKTIWFAEKSSEQIKALALLYIGNVPATLMVLCREQELPDTISLLKTIKPLLPEKFNAHISSNLLNVFGEKNILQLYGLDYQMYLKKTPEIISDNNIRQLSVNDFPSIQELYLIAYPGNWFDARMLETGKYLGYFHKSHLVGIAGIHVYSRNYKVAALGNIATHPDFRGRQIAFRLTSALCNDLLNDVEVIGLNVRSHNKAAINCYRKIGFEVIDLHHECLIKNSNE